MGNPLLRVPAQPITIDDDAPTSPAKQDKSLYAGIIYAGSIDNSATETNELITDLFDTAAATKGVGIAAPQIGVSLQVIVIASGPNARYPDAPVCDPFAVINPVIQWMSGETEKDWEGCLSLPGIRGLVTRSKKIKVLGSIFPAKEPVIMEYDGFIARIFQHEIDHLQGKLFIDIVERTLDLVTEQEYAKIRAAKDSSS
jgi:peptide deformylase